MKYSIIKIDGLFQLKFKSKKSNLVGVYLSKKDVLRRINNLIEKEKL